MHDFFRLFHTTKTGTRAGLEQRLTHTRLYMRARCAVHRNSSECIPFPQIHGAEIGAADTCRFFEHDLKDGLKIAGGPRNDAQDLGCRRLLLKRRAELTRSRLYLLKQPSVLDGNHCLVGEGRHQLDLLFCEWLNGLAQQHDDADLVTVPEQGHSQDGSETASALRLIKCIVGISENVANLDGLALL